MATMEDIPNAIILIAVVAIIGGISAIILGIRKFSTFIAERFWIGKMNSELPGPIALRSILQYPMG